MSDEPIYCYCPQGGGLLHIHRNPPYDTEGRLEMLRRLQRERVVEDTRLPTFEDDGTQHELPMSPNELKRLANANHLEACEVHINHGCCEEPGCGDKKRGPRPAEVLVGDFYLCNICADKRDYGKPAELVEPRRRLEELK